MTRVVSPTVQSFVRDARAGRLSRREFLSRSTAAGLSTAAALSLIGQQLPAQTIPPPTRGGGTMRLQVELMPHRDPRSYDWAQMAYPTAGTLEYLVEYLSDGSFRGMLLDSWSLSDDARTYTLRLRPGIHWSTDEAFTSADVARNFERWCDGAALGNSMADRFTSLRDPGTGQLRKGAVETPDPLTVQLNLSTPDITLIASLADYPAAITHSSYDPEAPLENLIGTGPMRIESFLPGERAVLVKGDNAWWGHSVFGAGYPLDRIELIDFGTDPETWRAAAEAGEIDLVYESAGTAIAHMDSIGWERSEILTAATIVVRPNQRTEVNGKRIYADLNVRRALIQAVDNGICLELGADNWGSIAENTHVSPVHPDFAPGITRLPFDPDAAYRLLRTAGMERFEFELQTIDDVLRRQTTEAVLVQLQDAGFRARMKVLPGRSYWPNWNTLPFSATDWNHRPLGTQVLGLAYRSQAPWNETGFADARFDTLLTQANSIADAAARQEVMADLQMILRDQAVMIQPYWRRLFRHHRPGVMGADMHPSYLPQFYRLGWAS